MNQENSNTEQGGGINFTGFKATSPSIIKVIGVGGGGGNAVNHMFREGIHGVTYVVCNTDSKALSDSPVPNKLQLGKDGLGAGNHPEKARQAAQESIESIRAMLSDGTRMAFITAGMGGGTGTGAAPIVAQCARDMDILTVGIVTIPFLFEGQVKIDQALDGVEELSKHVDAILVINDERLREIYPDLTLLNAFAKANDTLSVAARSIADIITMHGVMNLDFQDVTTVLKGGGVAIMSTGYAEGENRVTKAIHEALNSPLLNNNNIFLSKKVLLTINFSDDDPQYDMKMEEMNEIHDFMKKFRKDVETKWGLATDPSLGSKVKITLLASGFGLDSVPGMEESIKVKQTRDEDERGIRRWKYYPEEDSKGDKKRQIFIFTPEDMDNEEVISKVEAYPTYSRTWNELTEIRRTQQPALPETKAPDPSVSDNRVVFSAG